MSKSYLKAAHAKLIFAQAREIEERIKKESEPLTGSAGYTWDEQYLKWKKEEEKVDDELGQDLSLFRREFKYDSSGFILKREVRIFCQDNDIDIDPDLFTKKVAERFPEYYEIDRDGYLIIL